MKPEIQASEEQKAAQLLSVMPLYRQLSRIIETEISSGKWKQGDKIESEVELSKRFSVSRITVRAALEDLVDAGLLARVQGKGTFVTKTVGKQMIEIGTLSFTETCEKNGMVPRRMILEKKLIPANETDIVKLGLKPGSKVVHLLRVLYADNAPIILSRDHIHPDYAYLIDSMEENCSLNQQMMSSGKIKEFRSKERTIELCMASSQEADVLSVSAGAPMLLLRDLAVNENGKPVRWTKEVLAGDRVRIEYKTMK